MGFFKWLTDLFAVSGKYDNKKNSSDEYFKDYWEAHVMDSNLERWNSDKDNPSKPSNPWDNYGDK